MTSKTNPSYCSYLWQGLSLRDGESLYPCCRFELESPSPTLLQNADIEKLLNSPYYQKIREKALNGQKNIQCQKCYLEEENGLASERITGLSNHPLELQTVSTSLENIRHFEAFIGRICNLKCHSCHPQLSTKWEEDYRQAGWAWNKPVPFDVDYNQILSPMKNLAHLKIIGGEPALSKKTTEVLKAVSSDIRKNINVEISTNGMCLFSEEVKNLLAEYKSVHLSISIDGPEKINEVIRFPSVWKTLDENTDHYVHWASRTPNVRLILHCTVSSLNVFSLQRLEDWWLQKIRSLPQRSWKSRYAILTQPETMFIGNLPARLKQRALDNLPEANEKFKHIRSLLTRTGSDNPHFLSELFRYCSQLDQIRQTRLSEIIPELFG